MSRANHEAPARSRTLVAIAGFSFAIAGCVAAPPAEMAGADVEPAMDSPFVYVEKDERTAELGIDEYLRKNEGLAIAILEYDEIPDDVYLRFDISYENAPELAFLVDTLESAADDDGVPTERVIKITSWYIINVTPDDQARAPVLEMINSYDQDFWAPPKIFLDSDGDIRFEWYINVAAEDVPVHMEQVRDAVIRIGLGWEEEVYPQLLDLGLE